MENKAKLDNILQDAIKVITNPVGFYRELPKTGGFANPVIFLLVMAVIMGIVIAIFSLIGVGAVGAMSAGFGAIIVMPISALIGSFIGAGILFVVWKLMGSSESYETAYRCGAYSAAIHPITTVLGLIPYIGTVVGVVWGTYLMITASIEVHQLKRNTAYTVFGILGALLVVMNLSTESATRQMTSHVEELEKQTGQSGEMTPEQAGKAMGEFIKGMGDTAKRIDERTRGDNTSNKSPEPSPSDNAASDNPMTPEEAGKALGDFLKGFDHATKDMSY